MPSRTACSQKPQTTRQTSFWLMLVLGLSAGCALDWDKREADDQGDLIDGSVGATEMDGGGLERADAEQDGGANDSEIARPCTSTTCGRGSCNAHGGCDCEPGYRFDGERCQPGACVSAEGVSPCGHDEICRETASGAVCDCADNRTRCDGTCVDTGTDRDHCGSCGYACFDELSCHDGLCEQPVRALSLGAEASCALMASANGQYPLKCWGLNSGLYRGPNADPSTPSTISGVDTVRDIALNDMRTCAVAATADRIDCWGACGKDCGILNPFDQTAHPEQPASGSSDQLYSMNLAGVGVISVSEGFQYSSFFGNVGGATCAIGQLGSVRCFGYALFITDTVDRHNGKSVAIGATNDVPAFVDLDAARFHTCGVTSDARVACWGVEYSPGLLGGPTHCPNALSSGCTADEAVGSFVQKKGGGVLTGAASVSVSGSASCAVTDAGAVYCWGDNNAGHLGVGNEDPQEWAVQVVDLPAIQHVAVSEAGACALARTGQVYCWGYRTGAGLGAGVMGDLQNGAAFSRPKPLPDLPDALELKAGAAHYCARRKNGQVVCWGANDMGQLGDGTHVLRLSPTPVSGLF